MMSGELVRKLSDEMSRAVSVKVSGCTHLAWDVGMWLGMRLPWASRLEETRRRRRNIGDELVVWLCYISDLENLYLLIEILWICDRTGY